MPHFPLVDAQQLGETIELDIDVARVSGTTCFDLIPQRGERLSLFGHVANGLRWTPRTEEPFTTSHAAPVGWDGSDPVLRLGQRSRGVLDRGG